MTLPEACKFLLKRAFEDLNVSKVWCGYFKGNEKSKRVQEKLGFKYNRTDENVKVSLLNEVRTNVVNLMTKEDWKQLNK
jgi:RimJ/RimL family protein N-acetyltransferase